MNSYQVTYRSDHTHAKTCDCLVIILLCFLIFIYIIFNECNEGFMKWNDWSVQELNIIYNIITCNPEPQAKLDI